MSDVDQSRTEAIDGDANMSMGSFAQWYYVDRDKLERLGFPQYKPKKGSNFIRIVAPSSKGRFGKVIELHRNVGANGSVRICMKKMFDEPCAVCDYIVKLKEQKVSSTQIGELESGKRILLFVVDVTNKETEDEGPKWFDCPPTIYISICDLSKDKRGGATIDVSHPVNGKDIEFERKEKKGNPYCGYKLIEAEPIPEWWHENLPQFDDVLLIPSYDEVAKECSGLPKETSSEIKNTGRKSGREHRGEGRLERGSRSEKVEKTEEGATEGRRSRRGSRDEGSSDVNSEQADSVRQRIAEIATRRRDRSQE